MVISPLALSHYFLHYCTATMTLLIQGCSFSIILTVILFYAHDCIIKIISVFRTAEANDCILKKVPSAGVRGLGFLPMGRGYGQQ